MLDEQQGRGYGQLRGVQFRMLPHDDGIEHCLQIVVGMFLADVVGREDLCQFVDFAPEVAASGFVVNDTDVLFTGNRIGYLVQTVDAAADFDHTAAVGGGDGNLLIYFLLIAFDGERCQTEVYLEKALQIADDHFAVDELQAVEFHLEWSVVFDVEEFLPYGLVHGDYYLFVMLK